MALLRQKAAKRAISEHRPTTVSYDTNMKKASTKVIAKKKTVV